MSGRTFSFEINRTTSAPAATLFRLETDGGRSSEWAKPIVVQSSWDDGAERSAARLIAVATRRRPARNVRTGGP
jgi:hypothetical protein